MHVIVNGRVQGVFFRATTRVHAKSLEITGTVKNLPNGTVEVWAQGTSENLKILLDKLKNEPGMGEVSHFDIDYPEHVDRFTSFEIIY